MNLRIGRGGCGRYRGPAWRGVLSAMACWGGIATASGAQAPVRTVVENTNTWYSVFGDHRLGKSRWSLWYDVHVRREGLPGERWQQLLIRPGVQFDLTADTRVGGGYAYINTHQYGDDPIPARFPEHRLWQQVALSQRTGGVAVAHRFRLENRWLGVMGPLGVPGVEPEVERWRFTQRLRYQIRGTKPFGAGPTGPYATAFNEVFIGLGRDVQLNILEQNRLFAGVGWRFTPTWRAEAGYMEQQIIRASGRRVERNHTLTITLFSTAPLGR